MGRQDGRVAIVTAGPCTPAGAALSEAIIAALHEDGCTVVVADLDEGRWDDVVASMGDRGRYLALDVGSASDWSRVVEQVRSDYGTVDVLVNCTRIRAEQAANTVDMSVEDYETVVRSNQTGVFLGARAVLPSMLEAGRGSIVSVASIDGLRGVAGWSAYCAANHAIVGLTRAIALEVAAQGVRVNAVCSSPTSAIALEIGQEIIDRFVSQVPMGRLADPAEVARVVAFLASDDSSACTGATFVADSGRMAGPAPAHTLRAK